MADTVHIFRSEASKPNQAWRWRRVAANGRVIASSGEGYSNPGDCFVMAKHCCANFEVVNWDYPDDWKPWDLPERTKDPMRQTEGSTHPPGEGL